MQIDIDADELDVLRTIVRHASKHQSTVFADMDTDWPVFVRLEAKVKVKSMAAIPYQCTGCGVEGRKLWRQYSTLHIHLLCAECACKDQGKENTVGADGRRETDMGRTDQIGNLVPAVPWKEQDLFWGYTSVPQEDVDWWRALPT